MKSIAIIPARMGSSRFPGKPLAKILGKPMIGHVWERVSRSRSLAATVVATCDAEIRDYVTSIGGTAIMTSDRAHIKDPEVRKLADGIIDAQVREIAQMKRAIARLEAHPTADDAPDLPSYRDKQVAPPPPERDESVGVNTLQPIR